MLSLKQWAIREGYDPKNDFVGQMIAKHEEEFRSLQKARLSSMRNLTVLERLVQNKPSARPQVNTAAFGKHLQHHLSCRKSGPKKPLCSGSLRAVVEPPKKSEAASTRHHTEHSGAVSGSHRRNNSQRCSREAHCSGVTDAFPNSVSSNRHRKRSRSRTSKSRSRSKGAEKYPERGKRKVSRHHHHHHRSHRQREEIVVSEDSGSEHPWNKDRPSSRSRSSSSRHRSSETANESEDEEEAASMKQQVLFSDPSFTIIDPLSEYSSKTAGDEDKQLGITYDPMQHIHDRWLHSMYDPEAELKHVLQRRALRKEKARAKRRER